MCNGGNIRKTFFAMQVQADIHRSYRIWQYLRDGRFVDEQSSMLHFEIATLNERASVVAHFHMHAKKLPSGRFLGKAGMTAIPMLATGHVFTDSGLNMSKLLSNLADLTLWMVAAVHLLRLTFDGAAPNPYPHVQPPDAEGPPVVSRSEASSAARTLMFDNPYFGDPLTSLDFHETSAGCKTSTASCTLPVAQGIASKRPEKPWCSTAGGTQKGYDETGDLPPAAVAESASVLCEATDTLDMKHAEAVERRRKTPTKESCSSDKIGPNAKQVGAAVEATPSGTLYQHAPSARGSMSLLKKLTWLTTLGILVMLPLFRWYEQEAVRLARSFSASAMAGQRSTQNSERIYHDLAAPARFLMMAKQSGSGLRSIADSGASELVCQLASGETVGSTLDVTGHSDADPLPWQLPDDNQSMLALEELLVCLHSLRSRILVFSLLLQLGLCNESYQALSGPRALSLATVLGPQMMHAFEL